MSYHYNRLALLMLLCSGVLLQAADDGDLDTSFNNPLGYVSTPTESAFSVAIQTDGKIVAAGVDGSGNFRVARYNTDGTLDTATFGAPSGFVSTPSGSDRGLAIQSDGKIIAAGFDAAATNFRVVRYNTDGSLDTATFGGGTGFVTGPTGVGNGVALQSDGKIIAVGTSPGSFRVARYTTAGVLDTATFGSGTGFVTGPTGIGRGVVLQSDGKIVVAGSDGSGNFEIARYNIDGTLDIAFGGGTGFVTGPVGAGAGVVLQPDGKIVAAGNDGSGNFRVARYTTAGVLDTTFGSGTGFVTGPAGNSNGVALQPDGKIVAAGQDASGTNFRIVRYDIDGTLDITFGSGTGFVTGPAGVAIEVALQQDGKIVAAGNNGSGNFRVARYFGQQEDPFVSEVTFCTNCGPIVFGNRGCSRSLLYAVGCDVSEIQFFSVVPTFTQIDSINITPYDIETLVEPDCESCE